MKTVVKRSRWRWSQPLELASERPCHEQWGGCDGVRRAELKGKKWGKGVGREEAALVRFCL